MLNSFAAMRRDYPHDFVFFSPEVDRSISHVDLRGEEHHHLHRVLRMTAGDTAFVSNGRGLILECRIGTIESTASRLGVVGTVVDQEDAPLILALATLKKDAYETAVKQCTELGITRFVPFVVSKSHVAEYSDNYLDRLGRIALSAMKQSFRATLPAIDRPISFDAFCDTLAPGPSTIVADADSSPLVPGPRERPLMLVVGPEAGFTAPERERLAAAECELASVSRHRLRAETAAAVLTALVAG